MDQLDELLSETRLLMRRVDRVLGSSGAPPEHAVWDELRRVRLLPGDAVDAVAALRPSALRESSRQLRAEAHACSAIADALPRPDVWDGEAAEAYDDARRRIATRLTGGGGNTEGTGQWRAGRGSDADDSLDERLAATADLAQAVSEWMELTRERLAVALATVLSSSEGLAVTAGGPSMPPLVKAQAAADIAAHLLRTIADSYDAAFDLIGRSADLTTASPI